MPMRYFDDLAMKYIGSFNALWKAQWYDTNFLQKSINRDDPTISFTFVIGKIQTHSIPLSPFSFYLRHINWMRHDVLSSKRQTNTQRHTHKHRPLTSYLYVTSMTQTDCLAYKRDVVTNASSFQFCCSCHERTSSTQKFPPNFHIYFSDWDETRPLMQWCRSGNRVSGISFLLLYS